MDRAFAKEVSEACETQVDKIPETVMKIKYYFE